MPHQAVESRALATIGYSKRLHALEIEFRRGGTYRYLDVPGPQFQELLRASSKAHYYNTYIRGKYRAVRVRSSDWAKANR
ncbi:MAG: KTSC domain-containing protein [Chthoniobacterales bacterium]|nr:KTSC domain-containing protein [Chthoniobacterales bacterium]